MKSWKSYGATSATQFGLTAFAHETYARTNRSSLIVSERWKNKMNDHTKRQVVKELRMVLERHLVPVWMVDELYQEAKRDARLPKK